MIAVPLRPWIASSLLVLGLSTLAGAGNKDLPVDPTLLPGGGIADPAGNIGFFPNTKGGIDALDLIKGKLLWTRKELDRPLLATKDRLFAWSSRGENANQIRIVMLDTTSQGKRLLESMPVVFPDWVSVHVTPGHSFQAVTRLHQDELLLIWESRSWYAGGAAPTPEIQEAARKMAAGAVRVKLPNGAVEVLDKSKIPAGLPKITETELQLVKLAGRTYNFTDKYNPAEPLQMRRTLQAKDATGVVLWQYEIAGRPNLLAIP